ncbi:MAG: helix-turn-helix transcriptional regulator [Bacillota bacterium]
MDKSTNDNLAKLNIYDEQTFRNTVNQNIRSITTSNGWSQQDLANILGVSKATVNSYYDPKGTAMPNLAAMFRFSEYTGIPINDIQFQDFTPSHPNINEDECYKKYIGNYHIAYIDTSGIGKINNTITDLQELAISYGVISIVKANNTIETLTRSAIKVFCKFGMTKEDSLSIKESADSLMEKNDHLGIRKLYMSRDKFSIGSIDIFNNNQFLNISVDGFDNGLSQISNRTNKQNIDYKKTDKISITLYIPNSNRTEYIGGAGLISSISRGRNKIPCSQEIVISKKNLTDELIPDIKLFLIRTRHKFKLRTVAEKIYKYVKEVYPEYNEEVSKILIENCICAEFTNEYNKHLTQSLYLFDHDDDTCYDILKKL